MLANPAARRLYGLDPSIPAGALGDVELRTPRGEAVPATARPATRLLRGDTFSGVELWTPRRGDDRRWLGAYTGVELGGLNPLRVLSVRDVTARHELEERYRTAFELNPTAMSVVRLENLQFTEVNDSFLKLTGYRRDEVVGHTAADLGLSIEDEKRAALIRELRRGRAVTVVEWESEVRTKAGERRAVLSEGKLVLFGGDTCLIDTYIDITDRKRAETELSQAIRAIMSDPSWFVRVVQEKLFEIRSGNPNQPGLELLSARERDVLEQLASGKGNDAIAAELGLSAQTVRNYISAVYSKIGVNSRGEAIVWARERGLIFPS